MDGIKADDITISLLREAKPEGLFRYFAEHGHPVLSRGKGIYSVEGNVPFPTQIVVTGELDKSEHVWLGALSEKLGKQDLRGLLEKIRQLSGKTDRELADSVLEVSIGANRHAVEELKGDEEMCQALMEIMEPQLLLRDEEKIKEGLQKGLQKGIQGAVEMLREFGYKDSEIKATIIKKYGLSIEEAERYFQATTV